MTYEPKHRDNRPQDSCSRILGFHPETPCRHCEKYPYVGQHRALTLADNTVVPIQRGER